MDHEQIIARLAAAFGAGLILGLERESRGRAAGLRTTILVCMAATTAMILSDIYYVASAPTDGGAAWRPDPARLGAGILTGMGFIGAGVIVRHGFAVQGVTTAALLWFITVIGFCFGAGEFFLGGVCVAVSGLTLYVLPRLERFVQNEWSGKLTVTSNVEGPNARELIAVLEGFPVRVTTVGITEDLATGTRIVAIDIHYKTGQAAALPNEVVARLVGMRGVRQVAWD